MTKILLINMFHIPCIRCIKLLEDQQKHFGFHHYHHKHQGLDHLIHSVSKVTTALSVSSVFQLFSFLVVCSSTISKGFGFVAFFALRLATTKPTQRGTGYQTWGHPTQLRICTESIRLWFYERNFIL